MKKEETFFYIIYIYINIMKTFFIINIFETVLISKEERERRAQEEERQRQEKERR
jgi:hypothetical protein